MINNPWSPLLDIIEFNYKKYKHDLPTFINKFTEFCQTGTCIYVLQEVKWLKRALIWHIDMSRHIDTFVSRDACLNSANSNEVLRLLARAGYQFWSGFPGQQWINEYQKELIKKKYYVIVLLALKRRHVQSMVHLDRFLLRDLGWTILLSV